MAHTGSVQKSGTLAAVGLFFLAPLVAEFLLGNLPVKLLPALVVLAPMYGGGALLIRELVRRSGRGWPSIAVLGVAYGILEEAFTTQTLFNPNYLGLHLGLLKPAYIAALGIGGWWTIFVLNLHAAWSISVPIALVEALTAERGEKPWLGRVGLAVVSVLFVLGCAANTFIGYRQDHFIASRMQLSTAALVCVALVVTGFVLPRIAVGSRSRADGWSYRARNYPPWMGGVATLAAGSAVLTIPQRWGWGAAMAILAIDLLVIALIVYGSRRTGWSDRHKVALAAGAALAYAWHSFIETPAVGGSGVSVRVGNAIFTAGAVVLIAAAWRAAAASTKQESGVIPGETPAG